jgi:prepilin-type N-terminal cleavage/methylation domain-containing protein
MKDQYQSGTVNSVCRNRPLSLRRIRGFTLIEMLVVVMVLTVVSTITFVSLEPMMRATRVTSAYNLTLMTMRRARQRAVDERKIYVIDFVAPQTIRLSRQDGGVPVPPPVLMETYTLPYDMQFRNEPGIPTVATQTPDGFGVGTFAIDFDINVGGGGSTQICFRPDGAAYDQLGNMNNGVLYLAHPGELYSSRAITLFGLTGRMRGWRLSKNVAAGTNEWVQQ